MKPPGPTRGVREAWETFVCIRNPVRVRERRKKMAHVLAYLAKSGKTENWKTKNGSLTKEL